MKRPKMTKLAGGIILLGVAARLSMYADSTDGLQVLASILSAVFLVLGACIVGREIDVRNVD